MDEVQAVSKVQASANDNILILCREHPPAPGQLPMEPSMDGPKWLQMMKDVNWSHVNLMFQTICPS